MEREKQWQHNVKFEMKPDILLMKKGNGQTTSIISAFVISVARLETIYNPKWKQKGNSCSYLYN